MVATIFLPLTLVTGLFGMNLAWMTDRIDTPLAFILLGIAAPMLGVVLTVLSVRRRGTPGRGRPGHIGAPAGQDSTLSFVQLG